jgi:hypothetical protein
MFYHASYDIDTQRTHAVADSKIALRGHEWRLEQRALNAPEIVYTQSLDKRTAVTYR